MRRACRIAGMAGLLAAISLLFAVAAEGASGAPCRDGQHPCAITGPGTYSGTEQFLSDTEYWEFYATAGTTVTFTLTDQDDPSCDTAQTSCSFESGTLENDPSQHGTSFLYQSTSVGQSDSRPASTTFTVTLPASQTYEWVVAGDSGENQDGEAVTTPYAFSVQVAPPGVVEWPPPTRVKRLGRRATLRDWERAVTRAGCVWKLAHASSTSVPAGRVIALTPRAGTQVKRGSIVTILVSTGRPRRRRRG